MADAGNGKNGGTKPPTVSTQFGIEIKDLVEASVLTAYFIQKLGKVSVKQLHEKLEASAVEIEFDLLDQACEALRARGFASRSHGRTGGEAVKMIKLKNIIWANPPEVIQVTSHFLSDLVKTPEAEALVKQMNEYEKEGAGKKKEKERLGYADFVSVTCRFRSAKRGGQFFGGQVSDPSLMELVRKGPDAPKECDLRLPRDEEGYPIIPVSNLRGWMRTGLRIWNMGPAAAQYPMIEPARFERVGGGPIEKIGQFQKAVVNLQDGSGGCGLFTYEYLPAVEFNVDMLLPTRGFMPLPEFRAALALYAPRAPRGLSNGRSLENGYVELIGFQVREPVRTHAGARQALEDLATRLSPEGAAFARSVMVELAD